MLECYFYFKGPRREELGSEDRELTSQEKRKVEMNKKMKLREEQQGASSSRYLIC